MPSEILRSGRARERGHLNLAAPTHRGGADGGEEVLEILAFTGETKPAQTEPEQLAPGVFNAPNCQGARGPEYKLDRRGEVLTRSHLCEALGL